jgi:hypothetical protein
LNNEERHPVIGSMLGAVAVLLFGALTVTLAHSADPCAQMDRMVAARLAPLLDRSNAGNAKIIHRAVVTLTTAREYCDRGWTEEGLMLYRALESRIETYRRIGTWRDE